MVENKIAERNITLDYYKIFLSFLVIAIHIPPYMPSDPRWFLSNGIARIAVPTFFIINGYFLSSKLTDFKAIRKYIKHLFIIYLVWTVIYAPYFVLNSSLKETINYIFGGYFHLWYPVALIYSTLILFILNRKLSTNILLVAGIIYLLVGYFFIKSIYPFIFRDFFIAFPFLTLGYFIKQKNVISKMKTRYLIPIIFISTLTLLLESSLIYETKIQADFFLSLIILCPSIFMLMMKHSQYSNKEGTTLQQLSSSIYFVHVVFIVYGIGYDNTSYFKGYLIVATASILVSIFVIIPLNKRFKIFL